ncbi:MAG TPA: pitrilysin family protein [Gemmatimonadaceae bacterium]|nr:pitrilysin family protein [Gemmatimonadaceae bacterium]
MRRSLVHRCVVLLLPAAAALAIGCPPPHPQGAIVAPATDGRLVPLESLTVSYEAGGVHVIQRITHANDVVAAHLYLLGGARQLTPTTAGIEALLLEASEHGTREYPGAALRHAAARTGSEFVVHPEPDWTLFAFRGITEEFDSSWAILASRLMHPSLDDVSVALARSHLVGALRAERNTPDGHLFRLADSVTAAGHPYALAPSGTEQSLGTITPATLRQYADSQIVTSRMLLVVVGDVPRARVEHAVSRTLGTLPRGHYRWTLPPVLPSTSTTVLAEERELPTNYLLGYFRGPPASSEDYAPFRVATELLGARLHQTIREEHSLTYAAYAPFVDHAATMGGMYVTTIAPDRVIPLMLDEVRGLQEGWVTRDGLQQFIDQFIVDYYVDNETNAAQADFLARAQLYRGDYRRAAATLESLRHVRSEDVRRVARVYMRDIHFVYLGDTTAVLRRELERF